MVGHKSLYLSSSHLTFCALKEFRQIPRQSIGQHIKLGFISESTLPKQVRHTVQDASFHSAFYFWLQILLTAYIF